VRTRGGSNQVWNLSRALPAHLPEMHLFYRDPSTARATMCAVISLTKWLAGRAMALELLLQHSAPDTPAAAAAAAGAVRKAVPGPAGVKLAECVGNPPVLWGSAQGAARRLACLAVQSMVRAAALLDPELPQQGKRGAAGTGGSTRQWWAERALLRSQSEDMGGRGDPGAVVYKAQLLANPQLLASILQQLQQAVGAQAAAAAAHQATKLTQRLGGDVAALTEQLNAIQLGTSSSSSVSTLAAGATASLAASERLGGVYVSGADSSSSGSSGVAAGANPSTEERAPPVTPGDITVAVNALLVACKAAGALQGVAQLLEQSCQASVQQQHKPLLIWIVRVELTRSKLLCKRWRSGRFCSIQCWCSCCQQSRARCSSGSAAAAAAAGVAAAAAAATPNSNRSRDGQLTGSYQRSRWIRCWAPCSMWWSLGSPGAATPAAAAWMGSAKRS
jgi:hypothetical protein